MSALSIRPYQPSDGNLEGFFITALQTVYPDIEAGPWTRDLTDIPSHYMGEGGTFLVGTIDEQIVAIGGIHRAHPSTPHIAEMRRVAVAPESSGQGTGRKIIKALETDGMELGFAEIVLDTTIGQEAAWHIYNTSGYKLVARRPVEHPSGRLFDTLFYRKSLVPSVGY